MQVFLVWGKRPKNLVKQVVLANRREFLRAIGKHLRDYAREVLYGVNLGRINLARTIEGVETMIWVSKLQFVCTQIGEDSLHNP